MDKPSVSVCITAYNHEPYIKDCLLSVLTQSYDVNLEILVGDDGSSDGTPRIVLDIAERYDGLITLFRHEKNLGACSNLKYLIARAKGDYIAHLDGDDYWMPGKLAAQISVLEKNLGSVAAYTNAVLINDGKDIIGAFNRPQPAIITLDYLCEKGNFLNHSSLVYRQELRRVILDMPDTFIDYRIHLRLACSGGLCYVNQMLVAYRVGSATSFMNDAQELVIRGSDEAVEEVLQKNILGPAAARSTQMTRYIDVWLRFLITPLNGVAANRLSRFKSQASRQHYPLLIQSFFIALFRYSYNWAQIMVWKISGAYKLYVYKNR